MQTYTDLEALINDPRVLACRIADQPGEGSRTAYPVADDARRCRDILAHAMDAAGFINYPQEWWHWSYGDRYWAFQTSAEASLYGPRS